MGNITAIRFGNALIEKAYKDFGYKKLLDAGVQKN